MVPFATGPLKRPQFGMVAIVLAGLAGFAGTALAQKQPTAPAAPAPAAPAPAVPAPAAPAAPAPAAPAGPQVVELVGSQPEWTKVCGVNPDNKKKVCYTTRDFGQQVGEPPVLAVAVYDVEGEDKRQIRILMPLALLLKPGFRFGVDKGERLEGKFAICFPNGCFAEAEIGGPVINSLKKGTVLSVVVRNQVNNEITFSLPLKDFGKAFDGAAIDPKVLEEQQKLLQEQLQKKAEEERKALEGAAGGPAPAPAPAPAK